MELVNTKKISKPIFCNICEKERKHILTTYEDTNENNEIYQIQMQKCKSCGAENQI